MCIRDRDDEVDTFWEVSDTNKLDKLDFCKIFSKAWLRAASAQNFISGFESWGIYLFNPARIPQVAFAPSAPTHREETPHSSQNSNGGSVPSTSNLGTENTSAPRVEEASQEGAEDTPRISKFRRFVTPDLKKKDN